MSAYSRVSSERGSGPRALGARLNSVFGAIASCLPARAAAESSVMILRTFATLCAAGASVLTLAGASQPTTKPAEAVGYIGVDVRDIPDGNTVFSWFFPGPLEGAALKAGKQFDLERPDLLVAVDGQKMNAEQFKAYIGSRPPGTAVKLEYRPSKARGATIPDAINHEDQVKSLTVTVEPAAEWRGTE